MPEIRVPMMKPITSGCPINGEIIRYKILEDNTAKTVIATNDFAIPSFLNNSLIIKFSHLKMLWIIHVGFQNMRCVKILLIKYRWIFFIPTLSMKQAGIVP